jgi:ParB/RepB/Spo0J family partition protein
VTARKKQEPSPQPAPAQDPLLETKVTPAAMLPVNEVCLSGRNPRKTFDPERMEELKASIQAHGILEPIVVRVRGPGLYGYEIVAGERRYKAAQELGLDSVPVVIRELTDPQALECMLLENLQREDLQPLEEAEAIRQVLELTHVKQQDLAKQLGKSQSWIANRVRLANAPRDLRDLIPRGISPRHVFEILPYQEYEDLFREMVEALDNYLQQGMVPTIEQLQEDVVTERILSCSWNGAVTLDLDDLPRQYQDLKDYLDFHECPRPECKDHINVIEVDGGEHRFCLNKPCFVEKLAEAKGTKQADLQLKVSSYAAVEDCAECDNWNGRTCTESCTSDEECEDAYVEKSEVVDGEDDGEGQLTPLEKVMQETPKYPVVDRDDIPDLPNGRNGYETFWMGMNDGDKLRGFGCPKDCDKLRCQEGRGNSVLLCLDPACYGKKEREIRAREMRERRDLWKGVQEDLVNARFSQLPNVPEPILRELLGMAVNYWRDGAQKALKPWGKVDRVNELAETVRKLPAHSLQDAIVRVWVCKELSQKGTGAATDLIARIRDNGNGAEASTLEPEVVEEAD